jgi:sirohydrochlorin ferrochelatase
VTQTTALLLIAHGSRRPEANAELVAICDSLRSRGHELVQHSYLELAEPGIAAGGERCVAAGAKRVVMLPYFLSPGRHVVEDLTAARDELSRRFPDVAFILAEALGSHPLILQALQDRAADAIKRPNPA